MKVYIVGERRGIRSGLTGEEALKRMLDAMPRLPSPRIAAIDARREYREKVLARKAEGRRRYLRRYERRANG